MKKLLGTPALLVAARLVGALAGMGFLVLVTQTGGAELAGTISALLATAMLLGLAATLNIEAGAARFMVQALDQGAQDRAAGYIHFSRRFVFAISLTLVVAIWLATSDKSTGFALALATVPLIAWTRLNAGIAIGFGRVAAGVIPRTFLRQLFLLGGTAALIASTTTPTPANILAIYLAANLATALCQTALLHRSKLSAKPDEADAPKWVRLGLTLGLNVLYLEYAIHLIIFTAAFVLAPADLARLDVALKLAAFLKFANTAVNQAFMPRFSAATGQGDSTAIARWLALSNLLKLGTNLAGIAALATLAPHLLPLFGPEFAGLTALVLFFALEPLVATLFGPGANIISLSKRPAALLPILAATLTILITGTLAGGHLYGLWGVAVAFLAAATLWSASLALIAKTRLGIDTTLPASIRWAASPRAQEQAA